MEYFRFKDILFSFILVLVYIIIFYLIIKQSIRIKAFGRVIVPLKENAYKKHAKLFAALYVVLAIVYLLLILSQGKQDVYYAVRYDYYEIVKYKFALKWALNLIPFFIIILLALISLSKEGITPKGIVGDKLAFKWDEIQKIELENNTLKIQYDYRIILFRFRFTYLINNNTDRIFEIIHQYSNK